MKNEKSENNKELSLLVKNSPNDFLLLLSNIKNNIKLLSSIITYINEYFEIINVFYKQLNEINNNFLKVKKGGITSASSPIHSLGKVIKSIIQKQTDNLFYITSNKQIFTDITNEFSNLIKNLKSYQELIGDEPNSNQSKSSQIQPVIISLMKTYEDIEYEVINQYINKKYNKSLYGLNGALLENKLEEAYYLEKTFFQFEEQSKVEFLNYYGDIQKKTLNSFNLIKRYIKTFAEIVLKQNNINLYEIQNEIDFTDKNQQIANNNNQNMNLNIKLKKDGKNDMFKYRIKIIMFNEIQVVDNEKEKQRKDSINNKNLNSSNSKEDKNKDKKNNKKKKDKNKDKEKDKEIKEDISKEQLALTEEDVYNIVETIYSYDLKMVDRTEYILDLHKEIIEVEKLSDKLLCFDIDKGISETISDPEVTRLIELLNKEDNIYTFFLKMNHYRSTGKYQVTERAFNIFIKTFLNALDYFLKNKKEKLEGLIIIMSETFYIIKEGKKIYVQEKIKDHELFKKPNFWEEHLKYKIEEQIDKNKKDVEKMNIKYTPEEKQKRLEESILSQFIPISSYMTNFGVPKEVISGITEKIFQLFNVSDDSKKLIFSLINK